MTTATNPEVNEIVDLNTLRCLACDRGFRNRAGLGSHVARKHGIRLDGTPAEYEGRRRKDFTDQREVLRITVHSGELSIDFEVDAEEVRSLLSRHSDELIDSIVR